MANHLVLEAVPVGVQADRTLRGVAVVFHEIVARNPIEVLVQVRVVELDTGIYNGYRGVLAQAEGGRAWQAECGSRVLLRSAVDVAHAPGVVTRVARHEV